jgi:hypothetical protein
MKFVFLCLTTSEQLEEGEVIAEPMEPDCIMPLTYYNNGKCNDCRKQQYDYNYFYCEGYDQHRHREDRKHPHFYMNIDYEVNS